jgi:phosphoribosylformimino-5-aminoimidazole carboxamide ribotide isomerase
LYKKILNQFPTLYLVASGGVSCMQDLYDLEEAKVPAAIVGKAIYEGKIKLSELSKLL